VHHLDRVWPARGAPAFVEGGGGGHAIQPRREREAPFEEDDAASDRDQ
jgi:hypothetical protein